MTTFDQIAGDLQARRAAAGSPSYAEIALRIARIRELRGGAEAHSRPARTTVYDAFREGRRRMDTALVLDIVRALGASEAEVDEWAERCRTAHAGAAPTPVGEPAPAPEPELPPEPPAPPPAPPTVKAALLLCLGCLAINLFGRWLVDVLEIPLYLDMVGTAVTAIILGPWWGAGVGLSSNLLGVGISGYDSIPFAVVNVAGALVWGYGVRRFRMGTTVPRFFGLSAITALCCSVLAVPIILALNGETGNGADDVRVIIQDVVNPSWLAVASSNNRRGLDETADAAGRVATGAGSTLHRMSSPQAHLVLTVIGADRPGLVSAVSAPVERHGGSWQQSQMARLAGEFAGIVLVSVPEAAVEALEADLAALAGDGLRVDVRRTDAPAESSPTSVALHLLGTDRPGIVAEISRTIAAHGVGIESLATDLREAPMAGGLLFEVDAELSAPDGSGLDELRAALEQIADELMVELSLE